MLVVLDPPLGLVALLGFPALFLVARWFQRNSTAAYRRTRETIAALIVQFTETFGGIRAVQAFRREPRNDELHAALNEDNRQAHDRAFWLIAVFVPAVTLIGNLVTVAVLGYGALRVMDGDLAVGTLVSFLLYLRRFFDPLQDVAMFYNSYQSATAALEKLSGRARGAADGARAEPTRCRCRGRGGELRLRRRPVRLHRAHRAARSRPDRPGRRRRWRWSAPPARASPRSPGSRRGSTTRSTARCGSTASRCDRLADADLRRAVVMVTQESFLFSGTVADNIAFGRPGADREEIEAAARAIGAHEFIAGAARRLRHRRAQARRPAVGRAAAAGQLRPGLPRRPGGADPRRGDQLARRPERAAGAARPAARCSPTGRR